MLSKVLHIAALYDFYGALLTDKQKQCVEMHYLHDLSLSEIADEFMVSRQAVHDILRRAEQILNDYEKKLGLVGRYQNERKATQQVHQLLNSLPPDIRQLPEIRRSLQLLRELLD